MQTRITRHKWLILAAVVLLVGSIFLTATRRADAYPTTWSLDVPSVTQEEPK